MCLSAGAYLALVRTTAVWLAEDEDDCYYHIEANSQQGQGLVKIIDTWPGSPALGCGKQCHGMVFVYYSIFGLVFWIGTASVLVQTLSGPWRKTASPQGHIAKCLFFSTMISSPRPIDFCQVRHRYY